MCAAVRYLAIVAEFGLCEAAHSSELRNCFVMLFTIDFDQIGYAAKGRKDGEVKAIWMALLTFKVGEGIFAFKREWD